MRAAKFFLCSFSLTAVLFFSLSAMSRQISPTEIAPARTHIAKLQDLLAKPVSYSSWEAINDEFRELDRKTVALQNPLPDSWLTEIGELRQKADSLVPENVKTSAQNDVPTLFEHACVVGPSALKPGGKLILKDLEENVTRDIGRGSTAQNIERRLKRTLVGYALLGRSGEAEVKAMGKKLWQFCIDHKDWSRETPFCRVADLAIHDPARMSQQFQKVKAWDANNKYSLRFLAETDAYDDSGPGSARSAAYRRRETLKKSCEKAMAELRIETQEKNPALSAKSPEVLR